MSYNYRVADPSKTAQILKTHANENNTTTEMSGKCFYLTTDNAAPRRNMFVRNEVNLESLQLIWCDENVHNSSDTNNKLTLERLLRIVNSTKLFDDIDACQQFIRQSQDITTYLVCSTSLAETLVSQIHQFKNLRSIYIYCSNDVDWSVSWTYTFGADDDDDDSESSNESPNVHNQNCLLCDELQLRWTVNYAKVKTFSNKRGFLMSDLSRVVTEYLMHEKEGILSGLGRQNETTDNNSTETWWPRFFDILCQLPYLNNSHLRLVNELKDYYAGKEAELRILEEFKRNYTPERAVYWYTRDSIIFRLLNKALRQRNIELIFLFGFYIRDLYGQLKAEYKRQYKCTKLDEPIVRVYRSQIISKSELEKLKTDYYNIFLVNSFLSASLNRDLSLVFLQPATSTPEGYTSVLFEIELDTRRNTRSFADISHLSQFSEESEVLCTMGIYFRQKEFSYNIDGEHYTIKLELFDDTSLKEIKEYHQDMNLRRNLQECSRMFIDDLNGISMLEINIIFNELCNLFPLENDWLEAQRYHCLGAHWKEDSFHHSESEIAYYEKAIMILDNYKNDSELNVNIDIGDIHLKMAHYQMKIFSFETEHLDLAIASYILALDKPMLHEEKAEIYRKLSKIYLLKRPYSEMENEAGDNQCVSDETKEMLKYQNLELQETLKFCQPTDKNVLKLYGNLAYIQKFIGYVDQALVNFEKVIQCCMNLNNETDRYFRLWDKYQCIMEIYRDIKRDYPTALHYQLLVIETVTKLYSITPSNKNVDDWNLEGIQSNKSTIAQSYFDLADIYIKLGDFELARENLLISKKLHEEKNNRSMFTNDEQLMAIEEKMLMIKSFHKNTTFISSQ